MIIQLLYDVVNKNKEDDKKMNFKFNDADMVQVKEMYLPYLGKCSVMTPTLFDVENGEKQWFCADVLNKHRKESIDSENKK